jgi:hypothetical protein
VPSCPYCDYGVAWNVRVCPQCGTNDPLGSRVGPLDDGNTAYMGCAGVLCAGLGLFVLLGLWAGTFDANDVGMIFGLSAGGVAVFALGNRIEATIRRR